MKKYLVVLYIIFSTILFGKANFKSGLDVFVEGEYKNYIGKNIAIITNITGITSDEIQNVDILREKGLNIVKLFGPEHGIRGNVQAGEKIVDGIDKNTGIPVYSLYGKTKKPTKEMLNNVDVLIYDIQDIGSRSYTFISTMAYCMQEASKYNIEFIVLDRPIALNGNIVDGNILENDYSSFIGLYPIAYVYGMTCGELAGYINNEFGINCNLKVVKMNGYSHNMDYDDTGLEWKAPSPNIPDVESAYLYPATGIIGELGTLTGGAGIGKMFKYLGEPSMNSKKLVEYLNSKNIQGVYFENIEFTPTLGKYQNKKCNGIALNIVDKTKIRPFETTIYIMEALYKLYPDKNYLGRKNDVGNKSMFEKAIGTEKIRKLIFEGKSSEEIIESYKEDLDSFKIKRKKYLLY